MKIAIVGDTHFGYPRFYEDSLKQGRAALEMAANSADVVIHAGDMFDTRVPTLDTLKEVISIFAGIAKRGKPVIAIHGNHERRMKGFSNPLEILAKAGLITYLHGDAISIGNATILGVGSVPNEHAEAIIKEAVRRNASALKGYKILVIHQDIVGLSPAKEGVSLSFLEELGFDLIINGHIHKRMIRDKPKLIIPGSTVVAALDEAELKEKRGFVVYDTVEEKAEFVEIPQRSIVYKELLFSNASYEEVAKAVEDEIRAKGDALLALRLKGTLKEGLIPSLLPLPKREDVYILNKLTSQSFEGKAFEGEDIIKWGEEELRKRLKDKLSFDFDRLFSILQEDVDKAMEMILND